MNSQPFAFWCIPVNYKPKGIPSMKKIYTDIYDHHPIIDVLIGNMRFSGLIDTGCTYTILSLKSAPKEFQNIENLKPVDILGANGNSTIHLLGEKLINIPNYHRREQGFNVDVYLGNNIDNTKEGVKIDIILGMSFLQHCDYFSLKPKQRLLELHFWS